MIRDGFIVFISRHCRGKKNYGSRLLGVWVDFGVVKKYVMCQFRIAMVKKFKRD